jgi:hypothetical protein
LNGAIYQAALSFPLRSSQQSFTFFLLPSNFKHDRKDHGGWEIVWGDLINEWDIITLIVSVPTGTVAGWVEQQVQAQVQKFGQSLDTVSGEVMQQAIDFLTDSLVHRRSGERDINGLGVKAGIATYNRRFKTIFGTTKLPNDHQPYIGLLVTKPLPPK